MVDNQTELVAQAAVAMEQITGGQRVLVPQILAVAVVLAVDMVLLHQVAPAAAVL